METIEERATKYACDGCMPDGIECDSCYNIHGKCERDAYIAGAKDEREELLRWHDPKCPPAHRKPVLIKGVTLSGRKCLVVGVFYKSGLQTNTYYKVDPIGWREIHE